MERNEIIQKIIIPKMWDSSKSQELLDNLKNVSDGDIRTIWKEIKEIENNKKELLLEKERELREMQEREEREKLQQEENLSEENEEIEWEQDEMYKEMKSLADRLKKERLHWDLDWIIEDLKSNYLKIDLNVERYWFRWKEIHLNLPDIYPFKWYHFDAFIPYSLTQKTTVDYTRTYYENLFSIEEIINFFNALREYFGVFFVPVDALKDYNHLKTWDYSDRNPEVGSIIRKLFWTSVSDRFGYSFWLSDENVAREKWSRAWWYIEFDECDFKWNSWRDSRASMLLKVKLWY